MLHAPCSHCVVFIVVFIIHANLFLGKVCVWACIQKRRKKLFSFEGRSSNPYRNASHPKQFFFIFFYPGIFVGNNSAEGTMGAFSHILRQHKFAGNIFRRVLLAN